MDKYAKELDQKKSSNNAEDRGWSNDLDNMMGWTTPEAKHDSSVRNYIHKEYHINMGHRKLANGNMDGA